MKRVFSGIQPTGNLHLGNYLGAIANWVKMQGEEYECVYSIVDLHALTLEQEPETLRDSIREVTAATIAAGIDPNESILFAQSMVAEHTELCWMLNCLTPLGWLNRMTQFKEKAGKHRENASLGLFGYPVLMAADILLYRASHVPVGEDQTQHLELARDIAGAFNRRCATSLFPEPATVLLPETARIMSLRDGTMKMSKSDRSDLSRINLTDDGDAIAYKIRKAKTDPELLPDRVEGLADRPEADNLMTIYAALSDSSRAEVCASFGGTSFDLFKQALTELAIKTLGPVTQRMRELQGEPDRIDAILADGAERAGVIARDTIGEARRLLGLPRKG